jgi:predicted short-subunit dehydrogenase-like oxidoreductase (DUF2520 family)
MQVVMIGAGNMATVFVKVLLANNYEIVQVYSRTKESALQLASIAGCRYTSLMGELVLDADIYIIAVSDDAIENIASQLRVKNKLVIHTAGPVTKNLLSTSSENYGVLWPIKMIRKNMSDFGSVPVAIDASNDISFAEVKKLASCISENIFEADDAKRLHLHVLAAVTTNFTNHLYTLAYQYAKDQGIDFSLFYPIIKDAAVAIQQVDPAALQAGPAFRGNLATIEKHKLLLLHHDALLHIYNLFTKSIMDMYVNKK